MVPPELISFVKEKINSGLNNEEIKKELLLNGWTEADINEALSQPAAHLANEPQPITMPLSGSARLGQTTPLQGVLSDDNSDLSGPSKSKLVKITVVALALLIVLAGGAYAYFVYLPGPAKKVEASLGKIKDIKSYQFKVQLSETPKKSISDVTLEGKADYNTAVPQVQLFLRSSDEQFKNESIETRFFGKKIYVNLDSPLAFLLGGAVDKDWLLIDLDEIMNELNKLSQSFPVPGGEDYLANFEKLEQGFKFSEAEIKQINDWFKQGKVVKKIKKINSEEINNVKTDHYRLEIDNVALGEFLKNLGNLIIQKFNRLGVDEQMPLKEYQDLKPNEGINNFEIWLGKTDNLPYKTLVEFQDEQGKINISVELSDFNQPMNIEEPQDAVSLTELLNQMMGQFMGPGNTEAKDVMTLSGLTIAQSTLEDYYLENNSYPKSMEDLTEAFLSLPDGYSYLLTSSQTDYVLCWPFSAGKGCINSKTDDFRDIVDNAKDTDQDGLLDSFEDLWKTNKNKADTDGDGYNDLEEIENGYDPNGPDKL